MIESFDKDPYKKYRHINLSVISCSPEIWKSESRSVYALHFNPSKDMKLEDIAIAVSRDLKHLALDLGGRGINYGFVQTIDTIVACSWIITKIPKVFERFGFTVDREGKSKLGAKLKQRYFLNKWRDVPAGKIRIKPTFAYISKEDFVRRFGSGK